MRWPTPKQLKHESQQAIVRQRFVGRRFGSGPSPDVVGELLGFREPPDKFKSLSVGHKKVLDHFFRGGLPHTLRRFVDDFLDKGVNPEMLEWLGLQKEDFDIDMDRDVAALYLDERYSEYQENIRRRQISYYEYCCAVMRGERVVFV